MRSYRLKLERQLRRLQERVPDVVADAIDDIIDATAPSSGSRNLPPTGVQTYGPQIEGPGNAVKQPFFQYSQCSGKKRALLIGINYVGKNNALNGCINDAKNVKTFIRDHFGYKEDDIVILTDDASDPNKQPTRRNIVQSMKWLVQDAQAHDSLFFHYSGHGGQEEDTDGDESDGYDECILPVDYEEEGTIIDDEMHATMVKPLPPGCRLTAVFDACHSASALDLPYLYSTEGKLKEPNLALEAGLGLLATVDDISRTKFRSVSDVASLDMSGMIRSVKGLIRTTTGEAREAREYARETKTSPADVVSWSGCKDSQTSSDTVEEGKAVGAMSYAFVKALTQNPQQTYQELLISLREILSDEYSQKPQLSCSHPMDTNVLFVM